MCIKRQACRSGFSREHRHSQGNPAVNGQGGHCPPCLLPAYECPRLMDFELAQLCKYLHDQ